MYNPYIFHYILFETEHFNFNKGFLQCLSVFDIMKIYIKKFCFLQLQKYLSRYFWKTGFHTLTNFESHRLGARWTGTLRGRRRSMTNKNSSFSSIVFIKIWTAVSVFVFLIEPWWLNVNVTVYTYLHYLLKFQSLFRFHTDSGSV